MSLIGKSNVDLKTGGWSRKPVASADALELESRVKFKLYVSHVHSGSYYFNFKLNLKCAFTLAPQ